MESLERRKVQESMSNRSEQIREGLEYRQAWCFVNGIPDFACPDHAIHLNRDAQNDAGRTGLVFIVSEEICDMIADLLDAATEPDYEAASKLILTQSYRWVRGQSSWEHASDQQKQAALIGAKEAVDAAVEGRLVDRRTTQ